MTVAVASTARPLLASTPLASEMRRASAAPAPFLPLQAVKIACSSCCLREACLPLGLTPGEVQQVDALIVHGKGVKKGESLYRAGDPFVALYATRVGSFKTTVLVKDGREQVSGYHLLGDVVGFDGIGTDQHGCDAVALEDTDVCILPFRPLQSLAREVPRLQQNIYHFLSREISRSHDAMLCLGSMHAEERLALFLLDLSARYQKHGYSAIEFALRMTRAEIGSYLGLKLETVSRLFSRFHESGLIQVQGRAVKLIDTAALGQVAVKRDLPWRSAVAV